MWKMTCHAAKASRPRGCKYTYLTWVEGVIVGFGPPMCGIGVDYNGNWFWFGNQIY